MLNAKKAFLIFCTIDEVRDTNTQCLTHDLQPQIKKKTQPSHKKQTIIFYVPFYFLSLFSESLNGVITLIIIIIICLYYFNVSICKNLFVEFICYLY